MKSEEEIRADFWTQKVNWLKNVLRYGAPAFSLDELYQALLQGGWTSDQVARTTTRSFFGTPCPTLQMSLCKENDVYVIQNPGIGTMELTIQECKEPVSLTGASVASVVSMLQTYCSHYCHISQRTALKYPKGSVKQHVTYNDSDYKSKEACDNHDKAVNIGYKEDGTYNGHHIYACKYI